MCVLIPFRLGASKTNKKTEPKKKKTSYSNKATLYALPQLVKNLTKDVVGLPMKGVGNEGLGFLQENKKNYGTPKCIHRVV